MNSISSSLMNRPAGLHSCAQPKTSFDRNAQAYGPVAATVIGAVEAGSDLVSQAIDAGGDALEAIGDQSMDIVHAAGDLVDDLQQMIQSSARYVSDGAESLTSSITDSITDALDAAGDTAAQALTNGAQILSSL